MSSHQPSPHESTHAQAALPARRDLLALFVGLSIVTLALGGWLTSMGFGPWYDALKKPPFQPPAWVFSPVWTTIFVLLAVATWQVIRRADQVRTLVVVYGLQLALNLGWSLLFFTLAKPMWALVDIVLLDVIVVTMVIVYGRVHRPSGWMIVPYASWLMLATALNAWIAFNNP